MSPRGFASLDPEKRRRVAKAGGDASARSPNHRKWTPQEAKDANKKRLKVKMREKRK